LIIFPSFKSNCARVRIINKNVCIRRSLCSKVLLTLMIAVFFTACKNSQSVEYSDGTSNIKRLVISESIYGKPSWILRAKTAKILPDGTTIKLQLPEINLFDEKGQNNSTVTADNGSIKTTEGSSILEGSVLVDAKTENMILSTKKLYFDSKKKKIWTNENIVIHKGKTIVTGRGFTSNSDFTEIEINKQETRMAE